MKSLRVRRDDGQSSRVWKVRYLSNKSSGAFSVPDAKHPGWYQHVDVLMATREDEVIRMVEARGGLVVRIDPVKPKISLFDRVSNEYRARLLMAILFSIEGGMSAGRALEAVVEQESGAIRTRLNPALVVLRQGRGFLDAFRAMNLFDEAVLTIIEAGEEMGKLPDAIRNACDHLSKDVGAEKLLAGAMIAMGVDLVFSISSVAGTRFGLIPYLKEQGVTTDDPAVLVEFESALAVATYGNDLLLAIAVLVTVGAVWVMSSYFWGDQKAKSKAESVLLRVPVIKDLLIHAALASTAAIMSALMRGGVAFINACDISSRGSNVLRVKDYWREVGFRVEMGDRVGESLAHRPLDPSEQMVIMAHKDGEHLAKTFELIAQQRKEHAKTSHKKLAGSLVVIAMLYSSVSVLLAAFVLYVQNRASMGG